MFEAQKEKTILPGNLAEEFSFFSAYPLDSRKRKMLQYSSPLLKGRTLKAKDWNKYSVPSKVPFVLKRTRKPY